MTSGLGGEFFSNMSPDHHRTTFGKRYYYYINFIDIYTCGLIDAKRPET